MEDLFRSYWWLIFPLSWFVYGGFQSWLSYRANRDTLDLLKAYAASGREPPPELVARLNKRSNYDLDDDRDDMRPRYRYRRERGWYHVVLFGVLGMGFTFAATSDLYEAGPAFLIVAFVMGALSLASLVSVLTGRGPRA
jgi:amino acid permease